MTQFDNQGHPIVPGDARRRTLRDAGYAVDRHGPLTQRLMSAWQHYQSGGNAHHWNTHNPKQSQQGAGVILDAHGNVVGHTNSAGSGGMGGNVVADAGGGGGTGQARYGRQQPVVQRAHQRAKAHGGHGGVGGGGGGGVASTPAPSGPGIPQPGDANTNTAHLLNRSYADKIAGMQFDPQIQELMTQLEQGKRDTAQHQGDIGHWYDQVSQAQDTARGRDSEASQHAQTVATQAMQGILQSLGGSRGAGVVGAAGLNDLTGMAEQGSSQDRYNADLAPLIQQEAAGAHSREAALASQTANQRDTALVGLKGQRGQAKVKALMDIIQANNAGRQTNFQNTLAQQNAKLAAASLGINADQAYAGIANAAANTKMNQKRLALESLAAQQKSGAPNWAKLNYPDRQTVVHDAVGRAAATMAPDHWDDAYVRDRALKNILAGGYSSARGKNYRGKVNRQSQRQIQLAVDTAVRAAHAAWAAKHGG